MLLRIAVLLSLILVLVACGSPANDAPAEEPTAQDGGDNGDDGGEGDDGDDGDDGENGDDGEGGHEGGVHDAAALEAILPEEVGGIELNRNSFQGSESIEAGGFNVEAAAQSVGRSVDDVMIATATDDEGSIYIFAMHIEGAQGDQLRDAYQEEFEEFEVTEEQNVGGKDVVTAAAGGIYIYTTGELFFQVMASDAELAADALSKLP